MHSLPDNDAYIILAWTISNSSAASRTPNLLRNHPFSSENIRSHPSPPSRNAVCDCELQALRCNHIEHTAHLSHLQQASSLVRTLFSSSCTRCSDTFDVDAPLLASTMQILRKHNVMRPGSAYAAKTSRISKSIHVHNTGR